MTKRELIKAVAKKTKCKVSLAKEIVNETLDAIRSTVRKGKEVRLTGFGTFRVAERKARKGRNPKTGKKIKIPAKKVVRFRPGTDLRPM